MRRDYISAVRAFNTEMTTMCKKRMAGLYNKWALMQIPLVSVP